MGARGELPVDARVTCPSIVALFVCLAASSDELMVSQLHACLGLITSLARLSALISCHQPFRRDDGDERSRAHAPLSVVVLPPVPTFPASDRAMAEGANWGSKMHPD